MKEHDKDTRQEILTAAGAEFLRVGYEKASVWAICTRAGVTTGALYFFFKNKAELFRELVEPTLLEFTGIAAQVFESELTLGQELSARKQALDGELDVVNEQQLMMYFYQHRTAFMLLMTRAEGSVYADFPQQLRDQMRQVYEVHIRLFQPESMDEAQVDFLARTIAAWRFHCFMELMQSDGPLDEILRQTELVTKYAIGGWNKVMMLNEE